MPVDKAFFQGSEYQKPLKNIESWDNIFGVDCQNKLSCHNTGVYEMSDGGEGIIEYQCHQCHETPNSKFNKRRGKG